MGFISWKVKVKVTQLWRTLCNPMDCSLPGSCLHGILQAKILEWAAVPFSRGFSWPRNQTGVSCIAGRFFTVWAAAAAKPLQSCRTLCDPIDGSPLGSPIPGILQARILEWVAISFSNACKWKVKVKSSVMPDSLRPHGLQPTRLLCPWDFPGKSTGVGCHCLLRLSHYGSPNIMQMLVSITCR